MTEAVFSTNEGPPPKDRVDFVVSEFESVVLHSGFRTRAIFGLCLFSMAVLGAILTGKFPSLWRLPLKERVAGLEHMEANPVLAAPVLAVKAILSILYYEATGTAEAVGVRDLGFRVPEPKLEKPAEDRRLAS